MWEPCRRIWRRLFGAGTAVSAIFLLPALLAWLGGCQPSPPPAATAVPIASLVEEGKAAKEAIQRGDIPKIRPVSRQERAEYLGSQSCVPCHQKEAIQLKSRHARTLARVDHQKLATLFEQEVDLFDPGMGLK